MSIGQILGTSGDLEHPGRFPRLQSWSNEGRQTASFNLGPIHSKAPIEAGRRRTLDLFHLLKTAWPVLLADYIDSKGVSFGILCGDPGNKIVEQWSAAVDLEQPISRAVTLAKLDEWPLGEVGQRAQFNTLISRRGPNDLESKDVDKCMVREISVALS